MLVLFEGTRTRTRTNTIPYGTEASAGVKWGACVLRVRSEDHLDAGPTASMKSVVSCSTALSILVLVEISNAAGAKDT